jgi:quinol monooxygenase YgiN
MRAVIVILGTISLPPERRAAALEASLAPQTAVRDEPGCLAYVFSADPVDDGVISVVEQWADAGSLEAHFLHPNFAVMRGVLGTAGITGVSIEKHRVDASGPVIGADGVPTASFG